MDFWVYRYMSKWVNGYMREWTEDGRQMTEDGFRCWVLGIRF